VNWSEQSGISIELSAPDRLSLPLEVEQALYRVVQEALANVARHSHARSAWVNLAVNDSAVTLVILDDGQGCNPAIIHPGLGLRSMRERVETLGGKMAFLSAPSQGTRVEISIPCDRNRFLAKPDQGLSVYRAITADHEHLVR
jgi:signal transduction histidine kinase